MEHQTIKPKTWGSFVRAVSGLFITKDNPNGLTPKECTVVACFLHYTPSGSIVTKQVKVSVANDLNLGLQVATNYVTKFRKKGVITTDLKLHPVFYKDKIIIENGK